MMNIVAHNLLAMNANRQFGITNKKKAKSTEKLSSGYKINRAADDAAGLSISEKMRRQIRGLHKAEENIQDGISLCQVADGALNETHDILQRMNELAVKAGNDTNSQTDRAFIQTEIDALTAEIDRIANQTTFNEDIYPLLGNGYSSGSISGGGYPDGDIPEKPDVKPLSDSDYPGSNLQIVNASTISNYSSYVDGDGKTHYQLGSGTFKIEELTNCVFDVSGNTCIEDTDVKNVTIDCGTGTVLSVKNVTVDNGGNISDKKKGIGAAIQFNGANNKLNCYGNNVFKGGKDTYIVYDDTVKSQYYTSPPYYLACAGVSVNDGAELEINGTDTSTLKACGCSAAVTGASYLMFKGESAERITSAGIGSDFHKDGGKITINSGNIAAYTNRFEQEGVGGGAIGGGDGTNIIINGGTVKAYAGKEFGIGGGRTYKNDLSTKGVSITINGGVIESSANSQRAYAIGAYPGLIYGKSTLKINGGTIKAFSEKTAHGAMGGEFIDIIITGGDVTATSTDTIAIGGTAHSDDHKCTVKISGGKVVATARDDIMAIGSASIYPLNLYVDGKLTDGTGINDGNGHNVFSYQALSDNNPGNDNPGNGSSGTGTNLGTAIQQGKLWIHMSTEPGIGMFIDLVNATAKGIGVDKLDVSSMENAGNAINAIKGAIEKVSGYRNVFGSQQNRLEHAMRVNANIAENTTDAESRIRDTDVAKEMLTFSNENILAQAGQSMLSQANQSQQNILSLLS